MKSITIRISADTKKELTELAQHMGVNTSAYIKMVLTQHVNDEIARETRSGLTIGEQMELRRRKLLSDNTAI